MKNMNITTNTTAEEKIVAIFKTWMPCTITMEIAKVILYKFTPTSYEEYLISLISSSNEKRLNRHLDWLASLD